MNISRRDIESQFERVVRDGWLHFFAVNALLAETTTAHLLAIGSRETNLQNIRGDYRGGRYHGFGVMQVDIGTDPEFARNWKPSDVEGSIRRGTEIYLEKVRDTKASVGKRVSVRGRAFTGRAVEPDDLRRIATAAYNCGRWAHYHFTLGQHVDSTTTGKDYSRDVYDRAIEFADLLADVGSQPDAPSREICLQGKYARNSHKRRFGIEGVPHCHLPFGAAQETQETLQQADFERGPLAMPVPCKEF